MMTVQYHTAARSAKAIAEYLERQIDAGVYAGGDALPTIRALAEGLRVSPTTVNAAFAILRAQGRIVGKRRGGSIVVARLPLQSAAEPSALPGRNLAVANPDRAFLPLLKATAARISGERRLYTDIADNEELIALFRAHLVADALEGAHIGIASGALDAIERGLMSMTTPGDAIGLEDPTYPPYLSLARALGLQVVRMAIDEFGITPEALTHAVRARVKAIVVVPRAQNPTGASFDPRRARALRAILRDAPEVGVLEDDYLAMICGMPLHSITSDRSRWLHVRSLAKTIGPDIRVAPFASDELTLARIVARQRIGCGWVSNLLQDTAFALLDAPATKRLIRAAKVGYAKRRLAFLGACKRHGLAATGFSGFTVWIAVADEAVAIRAALGAGFVIDGGSRYRSAESPPAVRVTITTIDDAEADALAAALAAASWQLP
jgi:DNA-binding transcriptional MocR family regulator